MSKFWAYLKTSQFRNNLLIAIGSVVLIFSIAFLSLGVYTRHGTGIPVPQLKGMKVEQALSLLKEQGFEFKIDSVYVQDEAPGSVIEQDPDAGTSVKINRTIYLTIVTRLAPPVALPDLEPYTYLEAVAILSNHGLKVGDTVYKPDIARDRILEQRFAGQPIKAGTSVPQGSRIDLVLGDGKGASEVEIPNLINSDLDAAKFVLKQNGLTLGSVIYHGPISDSSNIVVIAQSPMKIDTNKVSIGTRINLTVAQGKKSNVPKPDSTN